MSRIKPVERDTADDNLRTLFGAIEKQLGLVPNMMRTMARSPKVLDGYLSFSDALRKGILPIRIQEQIALTVAELNACDYCLSAHTVLGRGAGLTDLSIEASRAGHAVEEKAQAALRLARAVVSSRGALTDDELTHARQAGLSDVEIVEIIAHVALNVFTNYFNQTAATDIDFPRVTAGQVA